MKDYALFLGCTTPTQVLQYELASRWVCKELGIKLVDMEDFVCCGFNQVHLSQEAGLLLAAMNLAYAEECGSDVLTLCAACAGQLAESVERLKDQETRDKINKKLKTVGLEYKGETGVKHISRVLYEDIGIAKIKAKIRIDLSPLRVAPHYGCHYLKPESALGGLDDPDNPKSLHQLVSAAGARPVPYESLHLCCGGKSYPVSEETAFYLVKKKLDNVISRKADCLVVQCQTCYLMYSGLQRVINERFTKGYHLPILLYPQLLGLAMGGDPKDELGLDFNTISSHALLAKAGIKMKGE